MNNGRAALRAAAAGVLLSALWQAPVWAQQGGDLQPDGSATSGTVMRPARARVAKSHLAKAVDGADDPESRPLPAYHGPQPAAPVADPGALAISVLGKTGLVVALMLGCAAGWKRLRGAAPAPGAQPAQGVQVTSTVSLGPQRFLHLVTVGRHQLLVGSSPQNVSLIAVLEGGAEPRLARERGSEEPGLRPHGPAREVEEWPEALEAPADRFEELLIRMRELESGPHEGEPAGSRTAADSGRREAGRDASRGAYGSHPEAARAGGPRGERDSVPRAGAPFEDGWSGRAGGATASPARTGEEDRPLSPGSLFRTSGGTAGGGSDA